MTWTKLSDDFTDDCWELSDGAHRLHIEALVWSNRKLLDCRIGKKDMTRGWAKHPDREFISELLDCGWWEDDGEAYVIHHHSAYQRTREQVLHQQTVNRAAGRRSGRERARRRDSAVNDSLNDSLNESLNERDGTGREGFSNVSSYSRKEKTKNQPREEKPHAREKKPSSGNGSGPYTPTAEQSLRIDENVRRGYES